SGRHGSASWGTRPMVLGRFSGGDKGEDVTTLIAKKNYTKAIEVIREQLQKQRNDPRLRLQLADVLVSAGKGKEAVTILLPLADEFAKEGFAAKAISVLKKIQKLDPGRRDIDSRLANLIQEKQKQAVVIPPAPTARPPRAPPRRPPRASSTSGWTRPRPPRRRRSTSRSSPCPRSPLRPRPRPPTPSWTRTCSRASSNPSSPWSTSSPPWSR